MSLAGERLNTGDSCFFQKEILKIVNIKKQLEVFGM